MRQGLVLTIFVVLLHLILEGDGYCLYNRLSTYAYARRNDKTLLSVGFKATIPPGNGKRCCHYGTWGCAYEGKRDELVPMRIECIAGGPSLIVELCGGCDLELTKGHRGQNVVKTWRYDVNQTLEAAYECPDPTLVNSETKPEF